MQSVGVEGGVSPYRRHARPAVEAALFGWLAAILNDWLENETTRPKGSTQAAVLIASTVCLFTGALLAAMARERLLRAVRARRDAGGRLPGPMWILGRGVALGVAYAWGNVPAYIDFFGSHPARVVASFFVAGAIGGAWLARSVIVQEHATRDTSAYAAAAAVLPAAMIGAIAGSAPTIVLRMHLDHAIDWAFSLVPFCGPVEIGALALKVLPYSVAFAALMATAVTAAKWILPRRAVRSGLGRAVGLTAATVIPAWVFARWITPIVLDSPSRACRNTPWKSPIEAMTVIHSPAYAEYAVACGAAVGAAVIAVIVLAAARRAPVDGPSEDRPGEGPYRS